MIICKPKHSLALGYTLVLTAFALLIAKQRGFVSVDGLNV